MHPRSLFSLAEHLERLSKDGDPLEVLAGWGGWELAEERCRRLPPRSRLPVEALGPRHPLRAAAGRWRLLV